MMCFLLETLFLYLFYYITYSQSPEQFYFFDFDGLQGWTIQNTGTGLITTSTSSYCVNPPCWLLQGQSIANYTLSTLGYHTIRIVIDARETGLHNDEYCYFDYKSPLLDWISTLIIEKNDNEQLNVQIKIPDNSNYNNQEFLYLRIGNAGDSNVDKCYIDNLEIYGVPYTNNPTINPTYIPTISPTNPTSYPSKYPTTNPSKYPTKYPTYSPSKNPSKHPTNNPSKYPTKYPTYSPSKNPSIPPTTYPSKYPTKYPSKYPTNNPTHQTDIPTKDPTNDPTYDPTNDPTKDPSIDPTNDPTTDPTSDPTIDPTIDPTNDPTSDPTNDPTNDPTYDPTYDPTNDPTKDPTNDPTIEPTPSPILLIPTPKPTKPIPTYTPTMSPIMTTININGEQSNSNNDNVISAIGTLEIIIGISGLALCIVCIGIRIVYKRKYKYKTNEQMTTLSIQDTEQKSSDNIIQQQTHTQTTPMIQMTENDGHTHKETMNDSDSDNDVINTGHITLGGFDLENINNKTKTIETPEQPDDDVDDIENIHENVHSEGMDDDGDLDVLPMVNDITPGGDNEYDMENSIINEMVTAGGVDIDMDEEEDGTNDNDNDDDIMKPKVTIGGDDMVTIGDIMSDVDVDVIDTNEDNMLDNEYDMETIQ